MAKKLKKSIEVNGESRKEEIAKMQLRMMKDWSEEEKERVSEIVWGRRKKFLKLIPRYEARTAMQRYIHDEAEEVCVEIKSRLDEHNDFLRKKKEEKLAAEEELIRAREKFKKAESRYYASEQYHANLQEQLEKAEANLQHEKDTLEEMQQIVLVHSTASMKQIYEHQLATMLVAKSEEDILAELSPDQAFEFGLDVNFIEHLPRGFKEKYDEATKQAIIEYCNLVINTKLAVDEFADTEFSAKIIPLFGSQDIAEILKLNGYNF